MTPSNSTQPYDDRGNASVSVTLPAGVAGDQVLTVYGNQTGNGTPEAYIKLPGVKVRLHPDRRRPDARPTARPAR